MATRTRQRKTPEEKQALAAPKATAVTPIDLVRSMFAQRIPTADLWRTYYGGGVDMMRIEQALNGANIGNMRPLTDLQRELLDRDPHIGSLAQKRFGLPSALKYELVPATGDGINPKFASEVCNTVRSQIDRIPKFRTRLFQLIWGLYDGRSSLEIDWVRGMRGGDPWTAKGLGWIHPRRLSFGPDRELRVVDSLYTTSYFPAVGEALRDYPFKFIEFRSHLFCEYPEREGLGPRALYWAFFKRFAKREQLILLELFGKPWRIVEFDKDAQVPAQKEDLASLDAMIANLGGSQSGRLPRGAKLNIEFPGEKSGETHKDVVRDSDEQLSKLFLGNTNTTDAKPGQGLNANQATVHQDEQLLVHKRDCANLAEDVEDQLCDAIVILNFGIENLKYAPRFVLHVDPETDKGVEIDRLGKALTAGLRIAVPEAYERAGYRIPDDDEPVLQVTAAPTAEGGAANPVKTATIVYPAGAAPDPGEVQIPPGAGGPPIPADAEGIDEETGGKADDEKGVQARARRDVVLLAKQPDTVNGSPETIIDKAIRETARLTSKWAEQIGDAVDGRTDAGSILRALKTMPQRMNIQPFARAAERRMLHGVMLGALDSVWERENDQPIAPVKFAQSILPEGPGAEPSFAVKPYEQAVKWFKSKNVVDKATFESMSARAKHRAFTIAGNARDDMLKAAHAELARQVQDGADLREFRKFMTARFEKAGWTPANASHVETIYRTNVMNAYSAGRHAEMTQPTVLAARPYWQIMGVSDDRTRDTHRKVQGLCIPASDSAWHRAYPPFGFNCRDRVVSRSEADVKRLGLKIGSGVDLVGLPDEGFESGIHALL